MPAYAKGSKVICLFRADMYITFGPHDEANPLLSWVVPQPSVNPLGSSPG